MNCMQCGKPTVAEKFVEVGHGNTDVTHSPCGHTVRVMTETANKLKIKVKDFERVVEE